MKLSISTLLTALMTTANVASTASGVLPGKAQMYAWALQVVVEAALKIIQAFYNPNGTKATEPYVKAPVK